jgi:hypothetical protein
MPYPEAGKKEYPQFYEMKALELYMPPLKVE